MTVVMMVVGALLQGMFHLDRYGVKMLSEVAPGLPGLMLPKLSYLSSYGRNLVIESLSIAAVVMAQTLLASGSYAMKYGDKLDNNRELLAYGAMNLASGFTGCCPINGSVSRSGIADSFGCRSQLMSLSAFGTMLLVLLIGTPLLKYLPVPILTGIVMTALWGILDFDLAKKLWKTSRNELFVFLIAFLGVLIFGTVYGVMIGVILSFFEVAIASVATPASFLGVIPGQEDFYPLERNREALPLTDAVIYRFSGNLFFANIQVLKQDIEDYVTEQTRAVILDASGIGSMDITAADGLGMLYQSLKEKGIRFYMTEHIADLNEQLRKLGLGYMIEEGSVRRTIHIALKDMGIKRPYPLEGGVDNDDRSASRKRADNRVQEFVWAFGAETEEQIEKQILLQIEQLKESGDVENLLHGRWSHMEAMDEDEWLEHLEEHLKEIVNISGKDEKTLARRLEEHRREVHDRIATEHPELAERFKERRHVLDEHLKKRRPEVYELVVSLREKEETDLK